LWVVYDEAHNTTSEQVELLDDLNPAGFFVASASPIRENCNFICPDFLPSARKADYSRQYAGGGGSAAS